MELQFVHRSSGQIQFRIAFIPDSRSLLVVAVDDGWKGLLLLLSLLLWPFLFLWGCERERGSQFLFYKNEIRKGVIMMIGTVIIVKLK